MLICAALNIPTGGATADGTVSPGHFFEDPLLPFGPGGVTGG